MGRGTGAWARLHWARAQAGAERSSSPSCLGVEMLPCRVPSPAGLTSAERQCTCSFGSAGRLGDPPRAHLCLTHAKHQRPAPARQPDEPADGQLRPAGHPSHHGEGKWSPGRACLPVHSGVCLHLEPSVSLQHVQQKSKERQCWPGYCRSRLRCQRMRSGGGSSVAALPPLPCEQAWSWTKCCGLTQTCSSAETLTAAACQCRTC